MFLGVDFGKKRIGLALGSLFPYGAGVLDGANIDQAIKKIEEICEKEDVQAIVIGMPIRSFGEAGTIAPEIESFANKIFAKTGLPIYFEQEQFSSSEASSFLHENEVKFDRKGGKVDEVSAIIILEQFLNKVNEMGIENIKPDISKQ